MTPEVPTMANRFQRLIVRLAPRSWAEAMEASTRQWVLRCQCGHELSLWDAGGIRWGGGGKSATYGRCPGCGQRGWLAVVRRGEGG
jgi:hypothetical protein